MRSWRAGAGALVVTAWINLPTTPGAQDLATRAATGVEPPRIGGEGAEEQVRALPGPGGYGQESGVLPTWLDPLADPNKNVEGSRAEERASEIMRRLRAPVHLGRLEAERARVQRKVFGNVLEAFPEASASGASPSGALPPTDRIYLFISESIPLETLQNYARDIAEIGDPRIVMVLRGFVVGMRQVLPTRRFVLDVLRKDLGCDPESQSECDLYQVNLVIDPLLFRRYDVREVPTVVYAQGVESTALGGDHGPPVETERFWCLSGDAGLNALLRRINQDAKSPSLAAMTTSGS